MKFFVGFDNMCSSADSAAVRAAAELLVCSSTLSSVLQSFTPFKTIAVVPPLTHISAYNKSAQMFQLHLATKHVKMRSYF